MRTLALASLLALAACASGTAETPEDAALAELRALDARLGAVAYRLSVANAELCPDTGPQTGLVLHNALQYGPDVRPQAIRYFNLSDGPGVMAVVPESPADRAGVQLDDSLIAAGSGGLVVPTPTGAPASDEILGYAFGRIAAAFERGPADLLIQRDGRQLRLTLAPVSGCAYRVQLLPSTDVGASADGRVVTVTTAFVRYAQSDDELALVVAHELAHNLLKHPAGISRGRERQADYVGAYLAARAGYDLSEASSFWRRFGEDSWGARLGVLTHPSPTARAEAIAKAVAEIERKKAAGAPLTPEAAPPA